MHEAAAPVRCHHAVAGDNNGQRIGAAGLTNWRADSNPATRELSVSAGMTGPDRISACQTLT